MCWPSLPAGNTCVPSGYRPCEFLHATASNSRVPLTRRRLALSRQTGSEPALTGLLRVFKNYYPEIIVGEVTRGRAAAFKVREILKTLLLLCSIRLTFRAAS